MFFESFLTDLFWLMCSSVLPVCMCVSTTCVPGVFRGSSEEGMELELWMIVSHQAGGGKHTMSDIITEVSVTNNLPHSPLTPNTGVWLPGTGEM